MSAPERLAATGELRPPMPASVAATWPGAIWVGEVEESELAGLQTLRLHEAEGYCRARLLVRADGVPRGFVELDVSSGVLDVAQLREAAAALPEVAGPDGDRPADAGPAGPPISIVLCTRDRPQLLTAALATLARLNYPDFEIVVVDNNPTHTLTSDAVRAQPDRRVRLVDAPIPGLARARNAGIAAATHDIVAFTDDDVLVDPGWLLGLARGFAGDPQVGCVTGIVPSGELNSLPQWYFDRRVTWARNCSPRRFSLAAPPPGEPMFPFQVGNYGTGANFAVRRDLLFELGGFDEAFGAGSPTGGGEDIDLFVRVLLAGWDLVYQPRAVVWHRHRAELSALEHQSRQYGKGLGAWLAKLLTDPRTAAMVTRRAASGLRHLRSINEMPMTEQERALLGTLGSLERRGVLAGPAALARARLAGGRARPLAAPRRRRPASGVDR
jgi:GT2 family glycosyltransferase